VTVILIECKRCLDDKPLDAFNMDRVWGKARYDRMMWCRDCWNEHDASRRDQLRVRDASKYAKRDGVEDTLTLDEWLEILDEYDSLCAYCSKPFECIDHYIPRKLGGGNVKENVRPACTSCNMSKGSKHPDVWLETREAC
jgi:5-methylcytosine-specific restriction endonuclease McrA